MNTIEYRLGNALVSQAEDGFSIKEGLENRRRIVGYDLDLLYVECRLCGKPVLWDKGKTSMLVHASGIDVTLLDSECMILSEGCPACRPQTPLFHMQVVRVAALTLQDFMLLSENKANA